MELNLEGNTSMQAAGHITIDLPAYMHQLVGSDFHEAREAADNLERVLAIGRHPGTGDVVFLTGAGELRQLDFAQFRVPLISDVEPTLAGTHIKVHFTDNGSYDPIELEATWAIRVSMLLISMPKVLEGKDGAHVSYVDDEDNAGPVT